MRDPAIAVAPPARSHITKSPVAAHNLPLPELGARQSSLAGLSDDAYCKRVAGCDGVLCVSVNGLPPYLLAEAEVPGDAE